MKRVLQLRSSRGDEAGAFVSSILGLLTWAATGRAAAALALLAFLPVAARAEWARTDTTLAWQTADGKTVWRFSFDPAKGKPFFDPVTVGGGPSLTDFKPADHPWHYGLWFSWKYINTVNYWEEDRTSGRAAGKTSWTAPEIATRSDGGATIKLNVSYTTPDGRTDVTEVRELRISAPGADGSYTIDWHARFTAGPEKILLDRTPMPGEPKGAVNGGYAGLSIRLAGAPLGIEFLAASGAAPAFRSDRWRPDTAAVASNFTQDATGVGGVALLSDPANAGENAPWYLIHSRQMRFMCAAILAPKPREVAAGGTFALRYRVAVQRAPWTPASLAAAHGAWLRAAK
ncbi:MAG: PmoA family protein [Verrucomicrobia bacterium]|nr:PmoA family protein [Verrucomicrobiota bacterium]